MPEIEKIAMLVVTRDMLKEQFRSAIDPKHRESKSLNEFATAIGELRGDDFEFTNEQISKVFLAITNQSRASTGVELSITKFVDKVYYAVHAVLIYRMQAGLKRS